MKKVSFVRKIPSGALASSRPVSVGQYSGRKILYVFFLIHMLAFGGSGFAMAYASSSPPVLFLYMHGGIAISVYTIFYLAIFGVDDVKWMFINSVLGIFGIYNEIRILLAWAGKNIDDYPFYVHVIPFLYYVMYTFLLRQAFIDFSGARDNPGRKKLVEYGYVVLSLLLYGYMYFRE